MRKVIISLIIISLFSGCQRKVSQNYFEAMNTFIRIQVYGENAVKAGNDCQKRIGEIDNLFNVTKSSSDVYKLNHSKKYPQKVNPEVARVLQYALDISFKTDGAFNPCIYPLTSLWGFTKKKFHIPKQEELEKVIPLCDYRNMDVEPLLLLNGEKNTAKALDVSMNKDMKIDLNGITKGYALDECVKLLKDYDIKNGIIDMGSDLYAMGHDKHNKDWEIMIKNPFEDGNILSLKVLDKAICTTSEKNKFFTDVNGNKYIDIFDDSTGRPVEGDVASVTTVSSSGMASDGYSTAFFVMGLEGASEYYHNHNEIDFIMITKDRRIYITKGLKNKFTKLDDKNGFKISFIK